MTVLNGEKLAKFAKAHQRAARRLEAWLLLVRAAGWKNFAEVRAIFPHADLIGLCTAFNFGGNKYRLISRIHSEDQIVVVEHVLTHKEYDRGNWKKSC